MYQRRRVLSILEDYVEDTNSQPVRQFLDFFKGEESLGWGGFADKCRQDFPDAMQELVPSLLSSGDSLIIVNVFRFSNFENATERDIALQFAQEADAGKHAVALEFLAKTGTATIKEALARRAVLPVRVRRLLPEDELTRRRRLPTLAIEPGTTWSIG